MTDDNDNQPEIVPEIFAILHNNLDRDNNDEFPLNMKRISADQKTDDIINQFIHDGKHSDKISTKTIDGCEVTTFNNLVWVPKNLQQRIVEWYHSNLQHAGINRTINSIGQTFTWKGLSTKVEKHILTCDSCQRNAYGKIPLTSALRDKQPWEVVHVDCCGPWKIRWHDDESGRMHSFEIHLLSMFDACTAWSKFCRIKTALSLATSSGFDKNWLCRYPRPRKVIHDNGNEFMGCEFQELLDSYGIEAKPTTVTNPTANAIMEQIHKKLGEQL